MSNMQIISKGLYKNNAEKNNYEIEKNDLEITFKFSSQKEADEFYKKYKK